MATMKQQIHFSPLNMEKLNKKVTNNHIFVSSKEALSDIIPIDWNTPNNHDDVTDEKNTKTEKR